MLRNSFCSSPWFHVKLNSDGNYERCRWMRDQSPMHNVRDTTIMEYYNSEQMKQFRQSMLEGSSPAECQDCYYQEQHGKLSGRQRQLLKSAVTSSNFELGLRSSPHWDHFAYSQDNAGAADYYPVDLQIDLGSVCNSACIMCTPASSTRLAVDYVRLHTSVPDLFAPPKTLADWTRDPVVVDRLVAELLEIKNLRYIHFLGGETLYNEAFYTICERLIDADKADNIIIGTTTNGTIFNLRLHRLIPHFKQFHLGISIESVTKLNDYIRYPSNIEQVLAVIDQFIELRNAVPNLILSMRVTPNVFTISEFDSMAEYLIKHGVIAESCNLLSDPECLRIELLPDDIRAETVERLEQVIAKHNLTATGVVNVRDPNQVNQVTADTIIEYYNFVKNYTVPDNVDELRGNLVRFLKAFETVRNNSILDYAPRYQDFLRRSGY
jgi:radical SAM protein with 4Fe4S-binding SPASM domain